MAVNISELELSIKGSADEAIKSLKELSATLETLKGAVGNGAGLASVAKQTGALGEALKVFDVTGLGKITSIVEALNLLKGVGEVVLPKFDEFSKGLDEATSEDKVKKVNKLTEAFNPFNEALEDIKDTLHEVNDKLHDTQTEEEKTEEKTKKLANSVNLMKGSFTEFKNVIGTVVGGIKEIGNKIGDIVKSSTEYIEDVNLFNVALGKYATEAGTYAETVSEALGVDPNDFLRNQGLFQTLTTGFGVASDRAIVMSQALTQLGYDISSFYNTDVEEAMTKLQSGLAGELEPLRRLGYDLSKAKLEEIAFALGIDKTYDAMTQAEKAQLRYYAILTQVTTAQGDMARTIEQPANQIRIFNAQLEQLSRSIGNILIPAMTKVLPYLNTALAVLREMADRVADFMGFEPPEFENLGVEVNGVAEALDDANESASALKKNLIGIDEVNLVGDTGIENFSSSFDFELPTYDFIGDVTSKTDELKEIVEQRMGEIEAVISGFSLTLGAILCATGNVAKGITLMAIGAIGLVAPAVIYWNSPKDEITASIAKIEAIVGLASLAVGAILAFSGANVGLGIGLLAMGAVGMGSAVTLNWNALIEPLKDAKTAVETVLSGAEFVIGAILAFSGHAEIGIPLMANGLATLGTTIAINWFGLSDNVEGTIAKIEFALAGAELVIGAVMVFSGANVGVGLGLMIGALATGVHAVSTDKNAVIELISPAIATVKSLVASIEIALGVLLCFSGVGMGLGLALIAKGYEGSVKAFDVDDNAITRKVKQLANIIIKIVNEAVSTINNAMHISFDGFSLFGKQVVPPFELQLTHFKTIPLMADGGMVETGQLFIAREAGAEMVGRIGNHTSVANNDQIVEGISEGVYNAVVSAMGNRETQDIVINLDGEVIYRNQQKIARGKGYNLGMGVYANV